EYVGIHTLNNSAESGNHLLGIACQANVQSQIVYLRLLLIRDVPEARRFLAHAGVLAIFDYTDNGEIRCLLVSFRADAPPDWALTTEIGSRELLVYDSHVRTVSVVLLSEIPAY